MITEEAKAKNELIIRIVALKNTGKLSGSWKKDFIKSHPEYDTSEGSDLVSNVVNYRTTDAEITHKLEKHFKS